MAVQGIPSRWKKASRFPGVNQRGVAAGQVNFGIAKNLAPAPVENHQRVVPFSPGEGRTADQHVTVRSARAPSNYFEGVFDGGSGDLSEVPVVTRHGAFWKQDDIHAGVAGGLDRAGDPFDIRRNRRTEFHLRRGDD